MSERCAATKGITHAYSTEQLLAFRRVPAEDKLRWLEEMQRLLERCLSPKKRAILQRFRRGEL